MKNLISKFTNKETILYLIFGVLTTAIDYIAYFILRQCDVNYVIANLISWCLAVAFAFVTNKLLVFNSRGKDFKTLLYEVFSFVGARVFSLVFSILFIGLSVSILGINDFVAKIISGVFVIIINYVLSKLYIFNKDKKVGKESFFKENILSFISFFGALIVLIVLYKCRKIYPFGDNMYLRSDCYHQYAPFHKELFRKLTSGESLQFSWNVGLGSNFIALYAYYLASPFNWFIGLVSEAHIIEFMNASIILKLSLCSFTMSYYLRKKFDTKNFAIIGFSLFYAFSSYVCAFSWNLMWLDCLFLLPLITLGIEKLIKEGKGNLYCLSLATAIISNYYIAIMLCIYSVLYFVVILIANHKDSIKYYIHKCVSFGFYSLISGGLAACLFYPAFKALSQTASNDFDFPDTLERYFSVFKMLSRALMNVSPSIFEPHDPNVYCTVAVFLLIPIYWISNKIEIKEKIGKTAILGILLLSFNLNIPNYIWHGFHFPNSLPCRESFIYIFLILVMSYEGFLHVKEASNKMLFGAYGFSVALFLVFEQLFVDDSYNFKTIYYSLLFITFYLFTFMLYRSKSKANILLATYFVVIIAVAETFTNLEATGFSTTTRSSYLNDNKNIETMLTKLKEEEGDSFYRIEKLDRRSKNDAAWHGYKGASIFSSAASEPISKLYGKLGFEESCNAYGYYGHTPFLNSIFNIKYFLSDDLLDEDELYTLKDSAVDTNNTIFLYENKYTLPVGFMIDNNPMDTLNLETTNPFNTNNDLVKAFGAKEEIFTRLDVTTVDEDNNVEVADDMYMLVYCTSSLDKLDVDITDSDGSITSKTFTDMKQEHTVEIGLVKAGSTVTVRSGDSEVTDIQIYAYSFDREKYIDLMNSLMDGGMYDTSYTSTSLTGKVNAKNDGYLFTSIPCDKGFSVYVDGKKVETESLLDALILVPVSAGTHTIEFKYSTPGLYLGLTISILSLIALIAVNICKRKINQKLGLTQTTVDE